MTTIETGDEYKTIGDFAVLASRRVKVSMSAVLVLGRHDRAQHLRGSMARQDETPPGQLAIKDLLLLHERVSRECRECPHATLVPLEAIAAGPSPRHVELACSRRLLRGPVRQSRQGRLTECHREGPRAEPMVNYRGPLQGPQGPRALCI